MACTGASIWLGPKQLNSPKAIMEGKGKGNYWTPANAKGQGKMKGKGKGKGKGKTTGEDGSDLPERNDLLPDIQWTCQDCGLPNNNPNKQECRVCGARRRRPLLPQEAGEQNRAQGTPGTKPKAMGNPPSEAANWTTSTLKDMYLKRDEWPKAMTHDTFKELLIYLEKDIGLPKATVAQVETLGQAKFVKDDKFKYPDLPPRRP